MVGIVGTLEMLAVEDMRERGMKIPWEVPFVLDK